MLELLNDADPIAREAGADALLRLGKVEEQAVRPLLQALDDSNQAVVIRAALALGSAEATEEIVSALVTTLDSPSRDVRRAALDALGKLGAPAKAALPKLLSAGDDPDMGFRLEVIATLWNISEDPDLVLPGIVQALESKDDMIKGMAVDLVLGIGPPAAPVTPLLVGILDDQGFHWATPRWQAAMAIGEMGAAGALAVPNLVEVLGDPDVRLRRFAAEALGKIGAKAKPAVPALVGLLGDSDYDVRTEAAEALLRIDPAEAVKAGAATPGAVPANSRRYTSKSIHTKR
jgi:HEAT repeat protein